MKEWARAYAGEKMGKEWQRLPEAEDRYSWEEYKEAVRKTREGKQVISVNISAEIEVTYPAGVKPDNNMGGFPGGAEKAVRETLEAIVRQYLGREKKDSGKDGEEGENAHSREDQPKRAFSQEPRPCWYCRQYHAGRPCNRLTDYLIAGKVIEGPDNKITLPSGGFIPRCISGACYLDRVDKFYEEQGSVKKPANVPEERERQKARPDMMDSREAY